MIVDDDLMLHIARLAQHLLDLNQKEPYNFLGNTLIEYLSYDTLLAVGITNQEIADRLGFPIYVDKTYDRCYTDKAMKDRNLNS